MQTLFTPVAETLEIRTTGATREMVLTGAAHLVWDDLMADPMTTPLTARREA